MAKAKLVEIVLYVFGIRSTTVDTAHPAMQFLDQLYCTHLLGIGYLYMIVLFNDEKAVNKIS